MEFIVVYLIFGKKQLLSLSLATATVEKTATTAELMAVTVERAAATAGLMAIRACAIFTNSAPILKLSQHLRALPVVPMI